MEYFNQSRQQHFGRLSEDELEIVRSYFKREKLKKNDFLNWNNNIIALHKTKDSQNKLSNSYKRLAFD